MFDPANPRLIEDPDEGFTLIELIVVVLILGILMAIAIPTFLSLTGRAKTNAAEADLTTAAQDEANYYTANGSYDAISPSSATSDDNVTGNTVNPGVRQTDPGVNWRPLSSSDVSNGVTLQASGKQVMVLVLGPNDVILGTASANGKSYFIWDAAGVLKYAVFAGTTVNGNSLGYNDFQHNSWASLTA